MDLAKKEIFDLALSEVKNVENYKDLINYQIGNHTPDSDDVIELTPGIEIRLELNTESFPLKNNHVLHYRMFPPVMITNDESYLLQKHFNENFQQEIASFRSRIEDEVMNVRGPVVGHIPGKITLEDIELAAKYIYENHDRSKRTFLQWLVDSEMERLAKEMESLDNRVHERIMKRAENTDKDISDNKRMCTFGEFCNLPQLKVLNYPKHLLHDIYSDYRNLWLAAQNDLPGTGGSTFGIIIRKEDFKS